MLPKLLSATVLFCLVAGSLAVAAPEYATAVVEQGTMTVRREGKTLSFKTSSSRVTVYEKDLVRVRDDSRVVLNTRDRATLVMGGNTVFQCEPWQASTQTGVFRMLFGRLRATVTSRAGEAGFAMKTRTATIGVKGTEFNLALSSAGNTAVLGIESTVTVAGSDGQQQWVGPNQVSVVVANAPATAAVAAPEEFKREMAKLNSPRADSPAALDLPAEAVLVDKGIVSKESLQRTKADKSSLLGSGSPELPHLFLNLDDSEGAASQRRGGQEPEPKK